MRPGGAAGGSMGRTARYAPRSSPPRRFSEEKAAAARLLYETTALSLPAIAAEVDVSRGTLLYHAMKLGWLRASSRRPFGQGTPCTGLALCPVRNAMHRRLYDALETRIRLAEQRGEAEAPLERERELRVLSGLTRMLEKLVAMDRADTPACAAPVPDADAEREIPYDVEALRRELTDKLERLHRARAASGAA